MPRYSDVDKLDDVVQRLNDEGWEITRYEYKRIAGVLFEFPTADVVEKERYDRLLENAIIISEALNKYQTADVVEVVRCKDCVFGCAYNEKWYLPKRDGWWCCKEEKEVEKEDFCSYGERKETDD